MVWDGEHVVGLHKLLFLYINVCSVQFCNHLFIGDFGRLPLGPVLGRAAPLGGGTTPKILDQAGKTPYYALVGTIRYLIVLCSR